MDHLPKRRIFIELQYGRVQRRTYLPVKIEIQVCQQTGYGILAETSNGGNGVALFADIRRPGLILSFNRRGNLVLKVNELLRNLDGSVPLAPIPRGPLISLLLSRDVQRRAA